VSRTPHIQGVEGKTVAVLGLGRTGLASVAALSESGATVWAWDDNAKAREAAPAGALADLGKADWSRPAFLVMSPGIAHTHPQPHPVAALAKQAGTPIIGDIELLRRACPEARYVGITGTNGKSTTTALIGHLLRAAGHIVEIGGNLGQAALTLRPLGQEGVYVLELSSYQLELMPAPLADVAILLNITPDHLGRHGGMEGYVAAKKRIFAPKGTGGIGIIGVDDEHCRKIYEDLRGGLRRMAPISVEGAAKGGVYAVDGRLIDDSEGMARDVLSLADLKTLPGKHNWQNVCAAYLAARSLGLDREAIASALPTYPGLAHRQELIATIAGVGYVNDSKATNADAAGKALSCYRNIYWIVGGRAKEGGLAGLEVYFPRIRHAFLIGECAEDFARQLGGALAHTRSGALGTALRQAHAMAMKDKLEGAVVLLSPACASWDQYSSFEARGDEFRALVLALQAPTGANAARARR
jgi:UDP-N-acetylmuramoylalanine--D-glutamate ligase